MKANELLEIFPEKSFTRIFNEQIKYIKWFHQIDDNQIENFKKGIEKLFEIDNLVNYFKFYLESNNNININNSDIKLIKENWVDIIKSINSIFKSTTNFDLNKNDLFQIYEKFLNIIQYNPNNNNLSFLADEFVYTKGWQSSTWKKIIESHIEKLENIIRIIKLENKNNSIISEENIKKLENLITKTKNFDEKYLEIEEKMNSILNYEKEITKEEIKNIWDFFNNQWKNIETKNEKIFKILIKWKNTDWIILAIIFWIWIIIVSIFNIHEEWKLLLTTIPLIATLTLFIIFFLKQYSNNKSLINSYYFKWISTNVMEKLLITREWTEEWKIILEKTLDKILEEPWKKDKWENETINLINTSIKSPSN